MRVCLHPFSRGKGRVEGRRVGTCLTQRSRVFTSREEEARRDLLIFSLISPTFSVDGRLFVDADEERCLVIHSVRFVCPEDVLFYWRD